VAKLYQIGVVGFSGYSGAELVRILSRHPNAELVLLEHRSESPEDWSVNGDRLKRRPLAPEKLKNSGLDMLLLATAPEISMDLVPAAFSAGIKVVDLSGAFRLRTADNFQRWYGFEHKRPDLLAEAVYGLPEFFRSVTKVARLVSNPGCYPTAANLALRPLVMGGVLDHKAGIICDAKSGVSGAGKKASGKTHFSSVAENLSAYAILTHRHVPEVLLTSDLEEREFSFTAQLLPVHRGILETIYARLRKGVTRKDIEEIYKKSYGKEPFVRVYPEGKFPSLQSVAYTNYCDLGIQLDAKTRRVVIVAAIDNLVKGAAGQAVQNMNLMLGLPETAALL
jgi:N-acetyl-gamma-glutamyl-phosphate reductase